MSESFEILDDLKDPTTDELIGSNNLIQDYILEKTKYNDINQINQVNNIKPPIEYQNTNYNMTFQSAKFNNEKYVLININPPEYGKRMPTGLVAVIDVSGSMNKEASKFIGYSRLDLIKHSLNTIVKALKDDDVFGIVTFSDNAEVILEPTRMNVLGKRLAHEKITEMYKDCSTNLWGGISTGLELLKNPLFRNIQTNICVFTDGISNLNPPRGILYTLEFYLAANRNNNYRIHTFGYGYDLDAELLSSIAKMTNSIYSYIPDYTMIGTTFINFLSYILATTLFNNKLEIVPLNETIIKKVYGYNSTSIRLGNIQFGQSKNILVKVTGDNPKLSVNFKSYTLNIQQLFESFDETDKDIENVLLNYGRLLFVETVSSCMKLNTNEALLAIKELHTQLSDLPVQQKLKPILTDLISHSKDHGQIEKAFLTQESYNKWGKLYIPSIVSAHLNQFCNNFKDSSVQQYGGKLFNELQETINDIFNKLEPPQQSFKMYETNNLHTNNLSKINNPKIGCFDGNGFIKLGNGSETYVRDVQIGSSLKTPNGIAKVMCVLKMKVSDSIADLVKINDMYITPWHPIIGPDGNWIFPTDHPNGNRDLYECDSVYNFILDTEHIVIINNIKCCTLAHNLKGEVIKHDFFGTYKVIDDLIKMPGWEHGYVYMENYHFTNDSDTGLINGWILDQ
jgi:hypothetical protein